MADNDTLQTIKTEDKEGIYGKWRPDVALDSVFNLFSLNKLLQMEVARTGTTVFKIKHEVRNREHMVSDIVTSLLLWYNAPKSKSPQFTNALVHEELLMFVWLLADLERSGHLITNYYSKKEKLPFVTEEADPGRWDIVLTFEHNLKAISRIFLEGGQRPGRVVNGWRTTGLYRRDAFNSFMRHLFDYLADPKGFVSDATSPTLHVEALLSNAWIIADLEARDNFKPEDRK